MTYIENAIENIACRGEAHFQQIEGAPWQGKVVHFFAGTAFFAFPFSLGVYALVDVMYVAMRSLASLSTVLSKITSHS